MSLDGYWLTGSFKLLLPSEALSLRDVEQGNQELPSYISTPYAIILFHLDFFLYLPFVHLSVMQNVVIFFPSSGFF